MHISDEEVENTIRIYWDSCTSVETNKHWPKLRKNVTMLAVIETCNSKTWSLMKNYINSFTRVVMKV